MTAINPAPWEPTVLSPYRYQARIDTADDAAVLVTADCDHTVIALGDCTGHNVYLTLDEVVQLIDLLNQSLTMTARYDAGEPDMIDGLSWREWRREVLAPPARDDRGDHVPGEDAGRCSADWSRPELTLGRRIVQRCTLRAGHDGAHIDGLGYWPSEVGVGPRAAGRP